MSQHPRLFTPGPLTTSESVRKPLSLDYGSRDQRFVDGVREIRETLVSLADAPDMECVLMQGSGTFGMESVLDTFLSEEDRILVLINGAYGRRTRDIASRLGKQVVTMEWPED
ncbi:MAG: 2-aminoethylphosphonate--pyruvate transaminase, partial [Bacteroidetes bacterium]|nr:2-aminoethylphosphonate--pyruvate transaminase [Bacteroidota bacterium]